MPLVNVDVKALECCVAAYLANDPVMKQEIIEGQDMHTNNQVALGLPNRLVAKVFIFRTLYGGTEYSFARDPDFTEVSTNVDFWRMVIERFYNKYQGIRTWHDKIQQTVLRTKRLVMPTGRTYTFEPYKNQYGKVQWPITNIKNYPVQGLGADLVMIMRISLYNRMKHARLDSRMIATVHDSILLDCPRNEVEPVVSMCHEVARDVPLNFQKLFGAEYDLPFTVEAEVGENYRHMEKI